MTHTDRRTHRRLERYLGTTPEAKPGTGHSSLAEAAAAFSVPEEKWQRWCHEYRIPATLGKDDTWSIPTLLLDLIEEVIVQYSRETPGTTHLNNIAVSPGPDVITNLELWLTSPDAPPQFLRVAAVRDKDGLLQIEQVWSL